MNVSFVNRSQMPLPKTYLKNWLERVWRQLKLRKIISKATPSELVVVLVDRAEGRALNKQFRGKNKATDVLSFEALDPESLGELVLCAPVLQRQAKDHDLSFRDEAAYLVLHGLLHLLGFEHENGGAQAKKMYALQDELFSKLV